MGIDWKRDSQSFDTVAEYYDTYRPGYPSELRNKLITTASLTPGDSVLEVGSGTGKATTLLIGLGLKITCLEPGKNLAAIADRKFINEPQINFVKSRFEDWDDTNADFDLMLSAQAYHWVPREVRMIKAHQVLKPGGYIALIWNMYPYVDSELRHELDQVYRQSAPEICQESPNIETLIRQVSNDISESGYFEKPTIERFPWQRVMTTQEYLGLLGTYSDHLRLEFEVRQRLFDGVARVIDQHGSLIEQHYLAVLHLAKNSK